MSHINKQLLIDMRFGRADNIRNLVLQGADVNTVDRENKSLLYLSTPLMTASRSGHPDCLDILIELGANLDYQDETDGYTALMHACSGTSVDCVQHLLEKGASVDLVNAKNISALFLACETLTEKKLPMVEALLNYGANPNLCDSSQDTPLMSSIIFNACKKEVVELLVNHGININAVNEEGCSALALACCTMIYPLSLTRKILELGGDPNQQDQNGRIPLMTAAKNNPDFCTHEVLELFVQHGIDAKLQDNKGKTLIDYLRIYVSPQTADTFLSLQEKFALTQSINDMNTSYSEEGNFSF